ncbi:hypothetical protein Tco_1237111 [Tanacetum coccineum]
MSSLVESEELGIIGYLLCLCGSDDTYRRYLIENGVAVLETGCDMRWLYYDSERGWSHIVNMRTQGECSISRVLALFRSLRERASSRLNVSVYTGAKKRLKESREVGDTVVCALGKSVYLRIICAALYTWDSTPRAGGLIGRRVNEVSDLKNIDLRHSEAKMGVKIGGVGESKDDFGRLQMEVIRSS